MDTYRTWLKLFELLRYYSWIVDRLHISTRMYQLVNNKIDYDFHWLEERLKAVGFRLIFCTRTPDSFDSARALRLKVSGKPDQYNRLDTFIRDQELMRKIVGVSMLPTFEVDISDNNIERATEEIADWMEEDGGLYADY